MVGMAVAVVDGVLVMGRDIEGVDPAAHWSQTRLQGGMKGVDLGLGEIAARHARLVGDHQHLDPGRVQRRDRLAGALDPVQPLGLADIAVVEVQHPVAIEEDGFQRRFSGHVPALRQANRRDKAAVSPGLGEADATA
jgi:hypothetical protein